MLVALASHCYRFHALLHVIPRRTVTHSLVVFASCMKDMGFVHVVSCQGD